MQAHLVLHGMHYAVGTEQEAEREEEEGKTECQTAKAAHGWANAWQGGTGVAILWFLLGMLYLLVRRQSKEEAWNEGSQRLIAGNSKRQRQTENLAQAQITSSRQRRPASSSQREAYLAKQRGPAQSARARFVSEQVSDVSLSTTMVQNVLEVP
ncbi:hypothetical protein BD289DRAFT_105989 [Coniella lustricola]|uniref:Uncharacterized protein n=1 Tax=Coniella lustricola TaxID=2025994 RepID=A0A2T2ZXM6_9PEZI|nr:hypothetical protein BD289DRAFT_105989 [Coniella lustricola]